ncbi:hypothetical protein SAMN05421636_101518 [Pricia antarctica]|uniref:Uncharacterized protein n=1 Tax=Pricia antarctica TaxID=641691 RepID=A0A1G6X3P8_9FLAO|nr:DUF6747 family protein [Pricia antarctica]SDD72543.1 hypothetical protein SAMN05421636_101518 [Pricia antarctica]
MKKLLLVKEIYVEAFRDWTYRVLKKYFKMFSWLWLALFVITLYAFAYRLSTGFAF